MKVIFSPLMGHSILMLTKKCNIWDWVNTETIQDIDCFVVCKRSWRGKKGSASFSLLTTPNKIKKSFQDFPLHMHARWRMTASNHHLIVVKWMNTIQSFYTSALRTAPRPRHCAWSARCLISLSSPLSDVIIMPNLDTQAYAGLYRTVPYPANMVHGCSSEGGRESFQA